MFPRSALLLALPVLNLITRKIPLFLYYVFNLSHLLQLVNSKMKISILISN